jgi:hypothetical protein
MGKRIKVDLNELRSEYESTYLAYYSNNSNIMEFEEWLEKIKNLIVKKPKIKSYEK